jgi:hypothetical protein
MRSARQIDVSKSPKVAATANCARNLCFVMCSFPYRGNDQAAVKTKLQKGAAFNAERGLDEVMPSLATLPPR